MTEGIARRLLGNPGAADGILHRALENGFMEVVAATLGGQAVHVHARGGEDPLPPRVPAGVRAIARQGVGQLDPAGGHLVTRQGDGQMLGPVGPDDVVEPRELDAEHLVIDVALDPMDVRLLGATAVVSGADGLADPVEKSRLRGAGRPGFTDGERRREATCEQDGIGDLAVRSNGEGHAHTTPLCSCGQNIAERVGVRKAYPTGDA